MKEREEAQNVEERRRAKEVCRQREREAEEKWQEEYERRLRIWVASGGVESEFDAAWVELRHRLLMERVAGDEERKRRQAFGI